MKRHLTEKELIEYEFKLASVGPAGEIAEHLESCGDCRGNLERLRAKFAALDLLKDDVEVSEELIARVVGEVKKPAGRIFGFRRPAWIGAAAAVLVIGVLLFALNLPKEKVRSGEVARALETPADEPAFAEVLEQEGREKLDKFTDAEDIKPRQAGLEAKPSVMKEDVGEHDLAFAMDRSGKSVKKLESLGYVAEAIAAGEISEEAPFAPASAIELVVLPRRDDVQITIYNSADMTLVRETRNLTLKRGWNWLQFMWANTLIDPTSLSLEPVKEADKIDIQQLVYPARLKDIGRWLIRSEVQGQVPFEITYFTSGLSWRAFYMGTLTADERKMRLTGYVRVANNSGETYEDAQTRLIVGKVHQLDRIADLAKRQYPYNRPGVEEGMQWGYYGIDKETEDTKIPMLGDKLELGGLFRTNGLGIKEYFRKEIQKEGLSEYFLYTIERTETIADKWGKRLESFDVDDIPVESFYKYDEERWGAETIRFVKFANDEEHELGDTPIPNGKVKIYRTADEAGYLSYVGGAEVKYIPVDEEVELNLGAGRLVKVGPKLMEFKTENYEFDRDHNIAGWDEVRTWKIEVTNTRGLDVEIEITRGFGTAYWKIETDDEYEKYDLDHVRFKAVIGPWSKREFVYTVTTYHGTRKEKN